MQKENKDLKDLIGKLGKAAGADALNFNKFSTGAKAATLTKAELRKLTPAERFAYNINK